MNYLYHLLIVVLINFSICAVSWAATVVEYVEMGNTQKAVVTEQYARMLNQNSSSYVQFDMKNGKAYMVNTKEKRVLEMDIVGQPPEPPRDMQPPPWGNSQQRGRPQPWERSQQSQDRQPPWGNSQQQDRSPPSWDSSRQPRDRQPPPRNNSQYGQLPPWKQIVKAELVQKGDGSMIAGYPTIMYQLKADDKLCAEVYFSKKALVEAAHLKKLLQTMNKMSSSRAMKGMPLPPCLEAYREKEAEFIKLGLPLQTVLKSEKGDRVKSKVLSIKTAVEVAPDSFALPTDYELKTEQELRKERQAKMREQMEKRRQ